MKNKFLLIRKQEGFTLIETLVAIAILMIAVAGPMVVANKSLIAALYAKDQSIASFLAQEGMELVRNLKDNAVFADQTEARTGFTDLFGNASLGQCTLNAPCGIWLVNGDDPPSYGLCSGFNNCRLNEDSDFGYIIGGSGNPTIFSRYFYVTQINGNEYRVTVVVTWKEGSILNDMTLRSEMTSWIM